MVIDQRPALKGVGGAGFGGTAGQKGELLVNWPLAMSNSLIRLFCRVTNQIVLLGPAVMPSAWSLVMCDGGSNG